MARDPKVTEMYQGIRRTKYFRSIVDSAYGDGQHFLHLRRMYTRQHERVQNFEAVAFKFRDDFSTTSITPWFGYSDRNLHDRFWHLAIDLCEPMEESILHLLSSGAESGHRNGYRSLGDQSV